jgi:hypothetical protein
MPPLQILKLSTRHPDGLLSRAARGTTRAGLWVGGGGVGGGGLRARRSRRHGEVTRRYPGQFFLVQLVGVGSGHLRRRMCRQSMVVRRSPRMPGRRLRRCCRPRYRESRDGPFGRWERRRRIPRLRRTGYARRPLRQIVQRGGRAGPPRGIDGRAGAGGRRRARALTLRPDWCGKRKRGNDRNAAQEMLHDFDPPLQFWIGQGISDAYRTLKRAIWINVARSVRFRHAR